MSVPLAMAVWLAFQRYNLLLLVSVLIITIGLSTVLAIAPILIFGWFSQKQLVRGLTFRAVR